MTLTQILVYVAYGIGLVLVVFVLFVLLGMLRGNKEKNADSKNLKKEAKASKKTAKGPVSFAPNMSNNFLGNAPTLDTSTPVNQAPQPFQAPVQPVYAPVPPSPSPVVSPAPINAQPPAQPQHNAAPARPFFSPQEFNLTPSPEENSPEIKKEPRFNLPF